MSIFLIRYVLTAQGSRPGAPERRMYEISLKTYEKPMKTGDIFIYSLLDMS